jgi:hypothetical protein
MKTSKLKLNIVLAPTALLPSSLIRKLLEKFIIGVIRTKTVVLSRLACCTGLVFAVVTHSNTACNVFKQLGAVPVGTECGIRGFIFLFLCVKSA